MGRETDGRVPEGAVAARVGPLLQRQGVPGVAAALIVEGQMVYEGGVGYRDLAQTAPLAPDARFYIYSVTKTMIATAVLQLAAQGRLGLDEAARAYFPDLLTEEAITVRQLLNHTSGLPDYGALAAYGAAVRDRSREPWTVQEFLQHTMQDGLRFAPGKGWAYSNVGYMLLRVLLERVMDAPLRTVLAEQFFEPLGLGATQVAQSLADGAMLTPGFTSFFGPGEEMVDMRALYHPGWVLHGVVISTAGEVARFMEALFGGQLLDGAMLTAMCEPQIVGASHAHIVKPGYGLGVMVDADRENGLVAGHGGGGPGYGAAAFAFEEVGGSRVVAVALANGDRGDVAMEVVFALRGLVGGGEA